MYILEWILVLVVIKMEIWITKLNSYYNNWIAIIINNYWIMFLSWYTVSGKFESVLRVVTWSIPQLKLMVSQQNGTIIPSLMLKHHELWSSKGELPLAIFQYYCVRLNYALRQYFSKQLYTYISLLLSCQPIQKSDTCASFKYLKLQNFHFMFVQKSPALI